MARLATTFASASSFGSSSPRQYYVTVLVDGLGSSPEATLLNIMMALAERFPTEKVLLVLLTAAKEVVEFKQRHGLLGKPGPLVVLSETNPFAVAPLPERTLVDLSGIRDLDELRNIMVKIAEHTHDETLLSRVKRGEMFRRLRDALKEYGDKIPFVPGRRCSSQRAA